MVEVTGARLSAEEHGTVFLPILEDANSIQIAFGRRNATVACSANRSTDQRTAGLLPYALQTASSNLKRTSFEPEQPTHVVIDRESVERRPMGASAWSTVEGPG